MPPGNIPAFAEVDAKLYLPAKQSAYEKQKADAEAKRLREEEETAAVYRDFVKSFDNDDQEDDCPDWHTTPRGPQGWTAAAISSQAFGGQHTARRHFVSGQASLKSRPGTLGRKPGGPAATQLEGHRIRARYYDSGHLPDNDQYRHRDISRVFNSSDDDDPVPSISAEDKAVSKPTLRLANLPPGTSSLKIKSLIQPPLVVEDVRFIPSNGPVTTARRSLVAIVTLSHDSAATDIDGAVKALQNTYLGFGYYLSLHRHLSSAVASLAPSAPQASLLTGSLPFGAKVGLLPEYNQQRSQSLRYAPPPHYGPSAPMLSGRKDLLYIPVRPPSDINLVRLIHKVLESLLQHGPEFEALLMNRTDVQQDSKWAWLWDARSEGGLWYRWRLWEIVTGFQARKGRPTYLPLFEDDNAWKIPETQLPFEHVTSMGEFVSDDDYESADDGELDDVIAPKDVDKADQATGPSFLSPLNRAQFAQLLSRLPMTISKLRKGDIARITAFAIRHARRGADEIVDMVTWNIEKPLAAVPGTQPRQGVAPNNARDNSVGLDGKCNSDRVVPEPPNTEGACMVGLYVLSDILSSSSTSGIRHAWRYRQLFECALRKRKVFETLGAMPEIHNWGRLRADKWRRSVGLVLSLWEGWCVFPAESQENFQKSFERPSNSRKFEHLDEEPRKNKWKVVEAHGGSLEPSAPEMDDLKDVECTWGGSDQGGQESLDGESMCSEDIDGEPMEVEEVEDVANGTNSKMVRDETGAYPPMLGNSRSRKRMRAVDMFADEESTP